MQEQMNPVLFKKQPETARIVVVETIYHQSGGCQASAADHIGFTIALTTDEQPYVRHLTISNQTWEPLDTGWVKEASQVLIVNEGKEPIEVDDWEIPPGQSMRGKPRVLTNLLIRCPNGSSKCTLYVYPK